MTDGMMEAHRERERNKAESRFLCQLVRYLKRPGPKAKKALEERAAETDEIRGGMVGTTQWRRWLERNLTNLLMRERGEADSAWMRLLIQAERDPWHNDEDRGNTVLNLYEELLRLSPFAKDQLLLPKQSARIIVKSGSRARPLDLARLKREAFERAHIDPQDDEFAFVLKLRRNKVSLEPVWIRQTTFQNNVPTRKGPARIEKK
jgi:hypothetical protein